MKKPPRPRRSQKSQIEIRKQNLYDLVALRDDIIRTLCDDDLLLQIAEKSYIHQNGFVKIVYETLEESVCRLHIYPFGAKADLNIHDHRWSFSSVTICGSLPMSLYEIDVNGSTEILHTYSKTENGGHEIQSRSSCEAIRTDLIQVPPLQGYYMPYDIFHRIEAVEELTITYVETYPAVSDTCHLVNIEDRSGEGSIQPEPLTVGATRQALAQIALKIQELV